MKRTIIFLLVLSVFIVGCKNELSDEASKLTIKDALEREINFSTLPERVIIAGKQSPMLANFSYLFESASEKLAAVENRSQTIDQFLSTIDDQYENKLVLEKFAGVEQIAPLDPDVVILKTSMQEELGVLLEEIGIKVVYVSFENVEEIYRDLRIIGSVFNEVEKAETLIQMYESIEEDIQLRISNVEEKLSVILAQVKDTDQVLSFSVPSAKWLQPSMVQELRAVPVWVESTPGGGWTEINIEQIFAWSPDIVMVINYNGKAPMIVDELNDDTLWQSILDKTKIAPFPYDYISWDQPDPRWILGYTSIAHTLYPESVDEDFLIKTIENFYHDFYGLSKSQIENEILKDIKF